MKFVFALALVAICVMIMHARPNIKRDTVRIQKRSSSSSSSSEEGDQHGNNVEDESPETPAVEAEEAGEAEEADEAEEAGQLEEEGEAAHNIDKRAAWDPDVNLWKDKSIKYNFANGYGATRCKDGRTIAEVVKEAADEWNRMSGLNIHLDPVDTIDTITIQDGVGCWSYVGYQPNGGNKIVLQIECCQIGVILHELGHAMGFVHEMQRRDRDKYMCVIDANVKEGMMQQFNINDKAVPIGSKKEKDTPYDFCSIMQYGPTAFAIDKKKDTVKIKDPTLFDLKECLGNNKEISITDGKRMAELYKTLSGTTDPPDQPDKRDTPGDSRCEHSGYMLIGATACCCSSLFTGPTCAQLKTDPECGNTEPIYLAHAGDVQVIETPGDHSYLEGVSCEWEVKINPELETCLDFNYYEIEPPATNGKCAFDWFQLIEDVRYRFSHRFCGDPGMDTVSLPPNEPLDTHDLILVFHSDAEYTTRGFQVVITASAPGTDCPEHLEHGEEIEHSYYSSF